MIGTFTFPGVQITNSLSWSFHAKDIVQKAQERLYLFQGPKEIQHVSYDSYTFLQMHQRKHSFWLYHSWYDSCSVRNRKKLQTVMNEAQSITQTSLPFFDSVYTSHCLENAASIIKDPTYGGHTLFHLLPSGKRYKRLRSRTNQLKHSFFLPPSDK